LKESVLPTRKWRRLQRNPKGNLSRLRRKSPKKRLKKRWRLREQKKRNPVEGKNASHGE
jgi:hypothetical protein